MTQAMSQNAPPVSVQPWVSGALQAVRRGEYANARRILGQVDVESATDAAWHLVLEGIAGDTYINQMKEQRWLHAVDAIKSNPDVDDRRLLRFLALLEMAKRHRRQDRPDRGLQRALSAHEVACGDNDQLWESAVECGLCASLARQCEAVTWFEKATQFAAATSQRAFAKRAIAHSHAATALIEAGQFTQAVRHAREALDMRRQDDPTSVEFAKAEMHVGHALCQQAKDEFERRPQDVGAILNEAKEKLETSSDSLAAFGAPHDSDVRWCTEQLDFADRMLLSLGQSA